MRQKSVNLVRRLGSTTTSYKSSSIQGFAVQNHERPCPRGDVAAVSCRYLSAVPQPAAEQPVKPFKGQTPSYVEIDQSFILCILLSNFCPNIRILSRDPVPLRNARAGEDAVPGQLPEHAPPRARAGPAVHPPGPRPHAQDSRQDCPHRDTAQVTTVKGSGLEILRASNRP
jgi:hypothetical protein